jgi:hypothetical protein
MMGALLDSAKANMKPHGSLCGVARIREQLAGHKDKTLRKDFDAALADSSISAPAIAKALEPFGVKVNHNVIGHHRRRDCSCKR